MMRMVKMISMMRIVRMMMMMRIVRMIIMMFHLILQFSLKE